GKPQRLAAGLNISVVNIGNALGGWKRNTLVIAREELEKTLNSKLPNGPMKILLGKRSLFETTLDANTNPIEFVPTQGELIVTRSSRNFHPAASTESKEGPIELMLQRGSTQLRATVGRWMINPHRIEPNRRCPQFLPLLAAGADSRAR